MPVTAPALMQRHQRQAPVGQAAGFGLLEVLIALVILSVGLLGIAGLITSTLKSNDSAYMRTQATTLAYNIIDRMRANLDSAENGAYNLSIPYVPPPAASTVCASNTCTPNQLTAYDLNQWEFDLHKALPQGLGAITTSNSGSVTVVTVTVYWNDQRAIKALRPNTSAPAASSLTINSAL